MKVSEWKRMLNKLNDDDNLCIAKCLQEWGVVCIDYQEPNIDKKKKIHPSYAVKEINKEENKECDYVIY